MGGSRGRDNWIDPTRPWADDEIRHLRKLWDDGINVNDIVVTLKRTKGSIMGKVHRLELPGRIKVLPTVNKTEPTYLPPKKDLSPPPPVLEPLLSLQEPLPDEPLDYHGVMRPLVKTEPIILRAHERIKTCMHTEGSRGNYVFCEAVATNGVWCAEHFKLYITKRA